MRPGREHDTTALREHPELLPALATWIAENRPALGDLGYEGEADTITVAFKNRKTASSPRSRRHTTRLITANARLVNEKTRCSR